MKSYACPWCDSGLTGGIPGAIFGFLRCPTCHVKVRWRSKSWYSWPAHLLLMAVLAPFMWFVTFLVMIFLQLLLLLMPEELFTVMFFIVSSFVFIALMAIMYALTRPWFKDTRVVQTDASREYWRRFCPVCREHPADDAIGFGQFRVCPDCKPEYVQRLKEGVAGEF